MTLPPELLWPGVVVIVVIAIFLTAALAGPMIRANMQDELDEPADQPKRDDPPRSGRTEGPPSPR